MKITFEGTPEEIAAAVRTLAVPSGPVSRDPAPSPVPHPVPAPPNPELPPWWPRRDFRPDITCVPKLDPAPPDAPDAVLVWRNGRMEWCVPSESTAVQHVEYRAPGTTSAEPLGYKAPATSTELSGAHARGAPMTTGLAGLSEFGSHTVAIPVDPADPGAGLTGGARVRYYADKHFDAALQRQDCSNNEPYDA